MFSESSLNDYAALLENYPAASAQAEMRKEGCQTTDILVSKGKGGQENSSRAMCVLIYVTAVEPILCLSFYLILHKQDVNSNN